MELKLLYLNTQGFLIMWPVCVAPGWISSGGCRPSSSSLCFPLTFHLLWCGASEVSVSCWSPAEGTCVAPLILSLCDIHRLCLNWLEVILIHLTPSCMKHEWSGPDIVFDCKLLFILCTAKLNSWWPLQLLDFPLCDGGAFGVFSNQDYKSFFFSF